MYSINKSELDSFLSTIAAAEKLYIPVSDGKSGAKYAEWSEGAVAVLDRNTSRSAKDFFFPQTETLVDFKVNGKNIDIIDNRTEKEDFVIFGVRACDVKSFEILDRVFLSDPVDSFYANRRAHGTIISLGCLNGSSGADGSCFCNAFGIDALAPDGDVRCFLTDKELFIEPLTDKGNTLINKVKEHLTECNVKELEKSIADSRKTLAALPLASLRAENLTDKQLETFKSEKWAKLSQSCLGCGTCTFVCPTCQCYDIRDFDTGHGIKRFRCWDSCMYSDFTLMSAGNPRLTQLERFRQRFMHKLVYYPINNDGIAGCVGCGRCLRKCPVSMNIVKVMKALGEDNND